MREILWLISSKIFIGCLFFLIVALSGAMFTENKVGGIFVFIFLMSALITALSS